VSHICLLERFQSLLEKTTHSLLHCRPNEIRTYLHYYPSIWRLHIHANRLADGWESASLDYGFTLQSVIENLKVCGDYYQRVSLHVLGRFVPVTPTYFVWMYRQNYGKVSGVDIDERDFWFQEELRRLDALDMQTERKDGVLNGTTSLNRLQQLFPTANISDALRALASQTLKCFAGEEDVKKNWRKEVRDIWMWPNQRYPPFVECTGEWVGPMLRRANKHRVRTSLVVTAEGKVCAETPGFTDFLWKKQDVDLLSGMCVEKHEGRDRIHLVHSDVVARIPPDELAEFIDEWNNRIESDVKWDSVKHTFCADYCELSVCVMLGLRSQSLDGVVEAFNQTFATYLEAPVCPSLHRTVAAVKRLRQ
jgi:hypothetical protein